MAKVVQFNSSSSTIIFTLLLVGCAHSARNLPPDMSHLSPEQRLLSGDINTPEYSMPCAQLKNELDVTSAAMANIERQTQANQEANETKKIIAAVFFRPALLAIDNDKKKKSLHRDLDIKHERLLRIAQARRCPP